MYAVHKNHQHVTTNTCGVFSIHNSMSIHIEVWRQLRVQQAAVWRKMCTASYCMEKNVYYKRQYGEKCVLQAAVWRKNYTTSGRMEKIVYYKRRETMACVLQAVVWRKMCTTSGLWKQKCVRQATVGETVVCVLQAAVLRQMCTTSGCI